MWHFPMDGEPAIIDAEFGNGIADGEFYVDLTFSEAVYGATGATGAVLAAQLNIFRVDQVEFGNTAPTVTADGTLFAPSRVTQLDGAALAGGESVIRAHFASSNHPNELAELAGESTPTLIAIRPTGGEAIYDANDNQIHGGDDDWYMRVVHDRLAPHISAAAVGPASQHIDLTFSEAVKFDLAYDGTTLTVPNTEPSVDDFVIVHYDASEDSVENLAPASITDLVGTPAAGWTGLRLMMPTGTTYASGDTVDIRIAEQVKAPTFPSLASVFTVDTNSKKYDSDFPRTAAPAQVGSLQLVGQDVYSIQISGTGASAGNTAVQNLNIDPSSVNSNGPLTVGELNNTEGTGIGVLIQRTETGSDGQIMLGIARANGNNNTGVSIRIDGESTNEDLGGLPLGLLLTIPEGESSILVSIKVDGNENPATGNRGYTFTLSLADAATQDLGTPNSVQLNITEDDDVGLTLTKGANPASEAQQAEENLQANSVLIDAAAVALESNPAIGEDDGVAKIIVEVDVQDNAGTSKTGLQAGNYIARNGRTGVGVNVDASGRRYAVTGSATDADLPSAELVAANNVVVFTARNGAGNADEPATAAQAQALLRLLRFFLPNDDDDIGGDSMVRITLIPPSGAGNQAKPAVTYTIPITPENDTAYTVSGAISRNEDTGASVGVVVLTGLSAVETGHSITNVTVSNVGNSALFSSQPTVTSGNAATVEISFTLASDRFGNSALGLTVMDDGEAVTITGPEIRVANVNDAPTVTVNTAALSNLIEGGPTIDLSIVTAQGAFGETDTLSLSLRNQRGLLQTHTNLVSRVDNILRFNPTATNAIRQANGDGAITVRVTDNGAGTLFAEQVITFSIASVNDAPSIAPGNIVPSGELSVGGTARFSNLAITDPDWTAAPNNRYGTGAGIAGVPVVRGSSVFTVELRQGGGDPDVAAARGVDIELNSVAFTRGGGNNGIVTGIGTQGNVFSTGTLGTLTDGEMFTLNMVGGGMVQVRGMGVPTANVFSAANLNTHSMTLTVVGEVTNTAFNGLLQLIRVSTEGTDQYSGAARTIRMTMLDVGNDGPSGAAGTDESDTEANVLTLQSDAALTFTPGTVAGPYTEAVLQGGEQPIFTSAAAIADNGDQVRGIEVGMRLSNGGVRQTNIASNLYVGNQPVSALGGFGNILTIGAGMYDVNIRATTVTFLATGGQSIEGAMDLLAALRFRLTSSQNDPSAQVEFIIRVGPHDNAPNQSTPTATVSLGITPSNDSPTFNQEIGFTLGEPSNANQQLLDNVLSNVNTIEAGQTIATMTIENIVQTPGGYNPALGDGNVLSSAALVADGTNIDLNITPVPFAHGTYVFRISLTDSGLIDSAGNSNTRLSNSITITVTPFDTPPTLAAIPSVTVAEGAGTIPINLSGVSNGDPLERPLTDAAKAGVFTPSFTGFLSTVGANPPLSVEGGDVPSAAFSIMGTNFPENTNGAGVYTVRIQEAVEDSHAGDTTLQTIERQVEVTITPVNDAPDLVVTTNPNRVVPSDDRPKARIILTDPDIETRVVGGSTVLNSGVTEGYKADSQLILALDDATAGALADSRGVDIDLPPELKTNGGTIDVGAVTITASGFAATGNGGLDITLTFSGTDATGSLTVETSQTVLVLAESGNTNTQYLTATVATRMSEAAMDAFLNEVIEVSVDSTDTSTNDGREIQVTFVDTGNDGTNGATGPRAVSNEGIISLSADPGPTFDDPGRTISTSEALLQGSDPNLLTTITINDDNEDTSVTRGERNAAGTAHGAAIASIRVSVSIAASAIGTGTLDDFTVTGGIVGHAYQSADNGRTVTITRSDNLAISTSEAQNIVQGLGFSLGTNNDDPPQRIIVTITLAPVDVNGINPTNAEERYEFFVIETNNAPTLTLVQGVVAVDEDSPTSGFLQVATGDPIEADQALTVEIVSSVISTAGNLDGDFNNLFTSLPGFEVIGTNVRFLYGTLAADRHGALTIQVRVTDDGGSQPPQNSPSVTVVFRVNPVNDPVETTPPVATSITTAEGVDFGGEFFTSVIDGPEEDGAVTVTYANLVLKRYRNDGNEFIISGDDALNLVELTPRSGATISSGSALSITGTFRDSDLRDHFNGEGTLTVRLSDDSMNITRTVGWIISPVGDGLDFSVPNNLSINPGESAANFLGSVTDPDVDALTTFAGNSGAYFQSGDRVEVTVRAPEDATDDEKTAVETENSISLRGAAPSGVTVATAAGVVAGASSLRLTFSESKSATETEAIFGNIQISVTSTATYFLTRTVQVVVRSSANDGSGGNEGEPVAVTARSFNLVGDQIDPVPPADLSVTVVAGGTEATLTWTPLQDRITEDSVPSAEGLEYTIEVTEGEQSPQTIESITFSSDVTAGYVISNGRAMYRITRETETANVKLIPGRTYTIRLSGLDQAGNPRNESDEPAPINYVPVDVTMATPPLADTDEDGIPDELEGIVGDNSGDDSGEIGAYCGSGGLFGDADNDGVPNNIEVRLGLECRPSMSGSDIARTGPADAIVPTITVNDAMIAAGAQVVPDGSRIVVPGTGERTRINLAAATCTECVADSVRAYVNTSSCVTDPGQARPDGDESVCPTSLDSFSNDPIVWVGTDKLGNWIRAESSTPVYVAPPVGFNVGVVSVASNDTSVVLPISVAVSAGNFSIGSSDFQLSDSALTLPPAFGGLDQDNRFARVTVMGITSTATEVGLVATANVRAASNLLTPPLGETQLQDRNLFSLGNARVSVIVEQPPTVEEPMFELMPVRTTVAFTDAAAANVESFAITSMPEAATYRLTAVILGASTPTLTVTPEVVTAGSARDVGLGANLAGQAIEVGQTIELTATGITTTGEITGRFFIVVIDTSLANDNDNDGVPDDSDIGVTIHDENNLAISLGGYARQIAHETDNVADRVYSAVIMSDPDAPSTVLENLLDETGGNNVEEEFGVFDYVVRNRGDSAILEPGGIVSVVIPLLREVRAGESFTVHKFSENEGQWRAFMALTSNNDRVYSAPAPCPGPGASREPDVEDPAWSLASMDGNQSGPGDACLLIQIQDGGDNDADGTANGVIHDPGGKVPTGGGGSSGGGSMDPIWLILLALAMTLPYGLRRRQSSPFISDL